MPKYILKEMPDMQGDGKRKIYPKLDAFRLLDTEDFVKEIHNYHHVYSTSLIESVLMDVADVLRRKLTDGYTVKIDDIGTFSLSLMFNDKKPSAAHTHQKTSRKSVPTPPHPSLPRAVGATRCG